MRILAIDAATRCGFAMGQSAGCPTSWSEKLKDPSDPPQRAFRKFGQKLRDLLTSERFDLIVVEAPLPPGAMIDRDEERGFKFRSNPATITLLQGLPAIVHAHAACWGIRSEQANVQTVRKHFLGMSRPKDPKAAVLAQCHQLGWLEKSCRDDNRADALALWEYAGGQYARALPLEAQQ